MNNTIYKRNIITAAVIVVVLFASMIASIFIFRKLDFNVYDNDIRLLLADQRNDIEKGIFNKGDYPYIVFGLDGRVVYSEAPFEDKPEEIINVQEMLQFDKSFALAHDDVIKECMILQREG